MAFVPVTASVRLNLFVCLILSLQEFIFHFNQDGSWVETLSPVPPLTPQWAGPGDPPPEFDTITTIWSVSLQTGSFAVQFPIMQDIPQNLLVIMTGKDVPIVTVTIPAITLGIGFWLEFIVWGWPEVTLGFGVTAKMSAQVCMYLPDGAQ